jgi:SAM-dependent methyltransferase
VSLPRDYDANPARYRLGMQVTARYLDPAATSLYDRIWQLLPGRPGALIADVGCADGPLSAARPAGRPDRVLGIDLSAVLVAAHPWPAIRADAAALPIKGQSVSAVVTVNMLYHLADPLTAIREARRVLRPGGVFIAATISRHDSPELAKVWRPVPTSFDAEEAPAIARQVFSQVEVERWDAPLVTLPDTAAVRDYLIARFVPADRAADEAGRFATPLTLTKRGLLLRCPA